MARPTMRGGQWSLTQVYTEAGVTLGQARAVLRQGYLDADTLTEDDIVVLRVAAGLLRAPRLSVSGPAPSAAAITARDEQALALSRAAVAERNTDPALRLAVFAEDVVLASTAGRFQVAIEDHPGESVTAMPLGQWIADLPSLRLVSAAG